MSRGGFTMIEMLLILVIVGVLMAIGFRPMHDAVDRERTREARVAATNYVAQARTAAVARHCRAVFHIVRDAVGRTWVTACRVSVVGRSSAAVDTLGRVDSLGSRYGVTVSGTSDSIVFDARGLNPTLASAVLRFQGPTSAIHDSIFVNALGRVVR